MSGVASGAISAAATIGCGILSVVGTPIAGAICFGAAAALLFGVMLIEGESLGSAASAAAALGERAMPVVRRYVANRDRPMSKAPKRMSQSGGRSRPKSPP